MQGGLSLAFSLMLYLGRKTYFGAKKYWAAEKSVPLTERESFDGPADELLLELVQRMAKTYRKYLPERELNELRAQRSVFFELHPDGNLGLYTHEIHGFTDLQPASDHFEMSYDYLWSLVVGQRAVAEYAEDFTEYMRYRFVEYLASGPDPMEALSVNHNKWLVCYDGEIRRLARMHKGLALVFDLNLFVSRKSVPPTAMLTGNPVDIDFVRKSNIYLDANLCSQLQQLENEPYFYSSISSCIDLDALKADRKLLEEYDIHTYLPNFRALLANRFASEKFDHPQSKVDGHVHDFLNIATSAEDIERDPIYVRA